MSATPHRAVWWLAIAAVAAALNLVDFTPPAGPSLQDKIASARSINDLPPGSRRDCGALRAGSPLVILALGQSNAGNHGQAGGRGAAVDVVVGGQCANATDPLPGSTGTGASVWSRLPGALQARGVRSPVVVSPLGIDGSSIKDWTDPDSPIPTLLADRLNGMLAAGLPPTFVLWQQGEADTLKNTSADAYAQGLQALRTWLDRHGVNAPILLGRSTLCRDQRSPSIAEAMERLIQRDAQAFRAGADTDQLAGSRWRHGPCHFSVQGLDAAAALWAEKIVGTTSRH